ncbi:hypothetical protein B7463_g10411, partial [Scytalidium lignicola]
MLAALDINPDEDIEIDEELRVPVQIEDNDGTVASAIKKIRAMSIIVGRLSKKTEYLLTKQSEIEQGRHLRLKMDIDVR